MPPDEIKVSVIMACHNSSPYLNEAVRSVLGQTLGDIELMLIDDGSTDGTLEIAKHYKVQDHRVSVFSLPVKSGPVFARNVGIRSAKGEWIGILDSDDVAMPSRLEEQMKLAIKDNELVLIGSDAIFIDAKGRTSHGRKYPVNHGDLVARLESMEAFPPHSSMLYRKDAVLKLSGFNSRYEYTEDYDLWLRLSEIGRVASVDKVLVKIRQHGHNRSSSKGGELQMRFAFAAAACHFLRIQADADPSTAYDDAAWAQFLSWIDKQLDEQGVYKRSRAWAKARAEYYSSENKLTAAVRFAKRILKSGHASVLLWEKIFGFSLPRRLAQQMTRL
jgi:glycosyltransferase involved in cell wall biosynthesis